jgi:hypothetical protein
MGLEHQQLSYFYNGLERRLTGPDEDLFQIVKQAIA